MLDEEKLKEILSQVEINPYPEWIEQTRINITKAMLEEKPKQFYLLKSYSMNVRNVGVGLAIALLVTTGGGAITVNAARGSSPGDLLFSLDKTLEDIDRSRTGEKVSKVQLEKDILKERIDELNSINETGDYDRIKLALQEVEDQLEKLKIEHEDCTDCSIEIENEIEDIEAELHTSSRDVRDRAEEDDEQEISDDASKLLEETEESLLETQKRELEAEQEAQKEELEKQQEEAKQQIEDSMTQAEKDALEQQLEEQKKLLEAQQEAEKKALEQQQEQMKQESEEEGD